MKFIHFLFFIFLFSVGEGALAQSQKAVVINDGALVYKEADFDAPVITRFKAGHVYDISLKTKGPFYKVRIKPGVMGWIADTDVRVGKNAKGSLAAKNPLNAKAVASKSSEKKAENDSFLEKKKPLKSFYASRYRGPVLSYITYNENTMGDLRSQTLPFYGIKVAGPNTMFYGDLRTDAEFLLHSGAPTYYQRGTGFPANGWIFLTDFIFETASPQSKWHMLTFGFGPMFKYSHYDVTLLQNAKQVSYSLDDMVLGAVFDTGLSFRIAETYALRFNVKYYWEKTKYWAGSVTFGFPF
ncbi:MAG: SH3 domain-containing protein [Pseudobdellovibrionaceae bacterium]